MINTCWYYNIYVRGAYIINIPTRTEIIIAGNVK